MLKYNKKFSNNSEANQLWREFDRSLDQVSVTSDQINRASQDNNLQCLSLMGLAVIVGKIQVALGAIEIQSPDGKLPLLHAKLQILSGTMFPYLAVRLKQSSRTPLESAIDALRTRSPETHPEEQAPATDASEGERPDADGSSVTAAGNRNRGRKGQG